jgi:peptidoglycan/LPS O-acetylase OafA/YrhL
MTEHRNNLDALRLLAAAGVMSLHVVDLSGQPALSALSMADTKWALSIFFVLSGYLVFQSCESTPSLRTYASKRLRRIVPAYVAVVLGAVLLGAALSSWAWRDYFGPATARYLVANLLFLNFLAPTLPGVFEGNTLTAVNGALWTIKVELMFYAVVPLLVMLVRRFGHRPVLMVGFVLSCLWWGGCLALAQRTGKGGFVELSKQMPGQLMFFLPGAWCYYERERLNRWGWRVGVAAALLLAVAEWFDGARLGPGAYLYPVALAAAVYGAGFALPYLGQATRWGDLSYGIYILHFPIIQMLVQLGVFKSSPWGGVAAVLMLVPALAWLSWHLIEAPALRRR